MLSAPSIDVMVLCHSLSTQDCDEALSLAHQRWPAIQTVALVSGSRDCGSDSADAVMDSTDGPVNLINAVRSRLN